MEFSLVFSSKIQLILPRVLLFFITIFLLSIPVFFRFTDVTGFYINRNYNIIQIALTCEYRLFLRSSLSNVSSQGTQAAKRFLHDFSPKSWTRQGARSRGVTRAVLYSLI